MMPVEMLACAVPGRVDSGHTLTTSGLLWSSELILGIATASLSLSMNVDCKPSTCLK